MEATAAEKIEIQQRGEKPNIGGEYCECPPEQDLVTSNSNIQTSKFPSVNDPLSISHQVVSMKNSEASESWTQNDLSNDIWQEILCRLPVKSLLRFRCVSKSWKYLIADPNFIRLHLSCFKYNCHQTHLLCVQQILRGHWLVEEWVVRCSDTSKITESLGWCRITNYQLFSAFGSTADSYDWALLCSLDGLIILRKVIFVPGESMRREYLLVNPSIKKVRSLIIHSMFDMEHEIIMDLGLGFDPLIKDYKFFRLVYRSDEAHLLIQVYTVGAGLWKTIQFQRRVYSKKHFVAGGYQAICTASFIYILEKNGNSRSKELVSFNVSNEKCASIQIPEHNNDDDPTMLHERLLRVDGGCSFLRICASTTISKGYLWVLGTPGDDSESLYWSKHYSFTITGNSFGFIYLKKNGDVLVDDDEKIKSLNVENNEERLLLNDTLPKTTFNAFEYKESLLWIE